MDSIKPRIGKDKDKDLAIYTGLSISWFRNARYEDKTRVEEGLPPKGPPYFYMGRSVRYDLDYADVWIDSIRDGSNPAYKDEAA